MQRFDCVRLIVRAELSADEEEVKAAEELVSVKDMKAKLKTTEMKR